MTYHTTSLSKDNSNPEIHIKRIKRKEHREINQQNNTCQHQHPFSEREKKKKCTLHPDGMLQNMKKIEVEWHSGNVLYFIDAVSSKMSLGRNTQIS